MRKIRKFKVAIHLKEILRRIKLSGIDSHAAGFALDSDIAVFISALHRAVEPGVVYELIQGQCMELTAAGVPHGDMSTICAITLGDKIEKEILLNNNPQTLAIANIIMYEFLRTAVIFVADLVKEDAKKEDFIAEGYQILYSPVFGYGPEPKFLREAARIDAEAARKALPALFERLNAAKINVIFQEDTVIPKATIVFILPWQKKKGKK